MRPSFAVATPEPAATAAGERILRAGGTAVDAAIASAAALTVTFPHNCALGGDLFALVRHADGTTASINASGPAGSRADAGVLRAEASRMPVAGPPTVTVPGLVAGWERLHAHGAALGWDALLADAIALSRGTPVRASLARAVEELGPTIPDPGLRALAQPGGTPLHTGDTLRQPALEQTLRELAGAGPRAFYTGPVGDRLAAGLERLGCAVTRADLHDYAVEETSPLRGRFRDLDVLTSPPNSSGVLLLQALAVLDAAGPGIDPLGAGAAVLAEALRAGAEQRDRALGDPRPPGAAVVGWLGADRVGAIAREALRAAAGERPASATSRSPRPGGDTVAVVAIDGDGRAVSLIQSVFHSFGSGLLEPETGVVLHNRGAFFSLVPGHPNELRPGRRPAHTLMPVLVEHGGALRYALGTMGGKAQPQILAQVLLRLLAGSPAQEAVSAPRWIVGGVEQGERDDTIRLEEGLDPAAAGALVTARLRPLALPRLDESFGHAQAIAVRPDGTPDAGSDPRAGGRAALG